MYNQEIETEEPEVAEDTEDVSAPLMDQQTIDIRKNYSERMIRMSSSWEVACNMPRTEAANVPWALLSEEKIARWIFGVLKHNEAIQYAVRPGVRPKGLPEDEGYLPDLHERPRVDRRAGEGEAGRGSLRGMAAGGRQ
jgi:hypothetical protein